MEFWKMVPMILHAGQQGRHRCKTQTFELSRRKSGWDDLRQYHWNMYITICKIDDQLQVWCMKQSIQSRYSGTTQDRVGRKVGKGVQNCGGHLYTGGWFMLMYGKQSQYCKVIILQLNSFFKICFSLNALLFLLYFLQFHYDMSDCEFLLFVFRGICQGILNVVFNL